MKDIISRETNKYNLAIVGIFWDGYYDLWEDFLELKERYWPNCPYPLYIVNQSKRLQFDKQYDVTVINAGGDAEYSRKVQVALQTIHADFFLLLLDDFFFSEKLEGAVLNKQISFMKDNDLLYYSMPLKEFANTWRGSAYKGQKGILNMRKSAEYTVCCQPAIWERSFLNKCIGDGNYNAWVFEGIYVKSKDAHSNSFLCHCKVDVNNILSLRHGALQGKMLPSTTSYFKKAGYKMRNTRPDLSKKALQVDRLKNVLKTYLPLEIQKFLKKIIKSESVIDKYETDIHAEMKKMGIK